MKKRSELLFYVTVCMGTALSTSSFTVMAGMFETINGLWAVVSVVLAGLFCILIADSIAELASRYPAAPGIRTYLKNALDKKTSLFFAYLYCLFIVLIGSVESCMFSLVVRTLFPSVPPYWVITGMLFSVILFNLVGLSLPRKVQIITTSVVVLAMLAIGLAGVYAGRAELPRVAAGLGDPGQLRWIPVSLGMAIFLYVGFEWVTPLGFSATSYKRRIPVSMPLGILLNIVVYAVFVLGLVLVLPGPQIAETVFPHVGYLAALFGRAGQWCALVLSAFAIISTFNSGIMGGSRLLYALGREGSMPRVVTTLSGSGVPYVAILLLGGSVYLAALLVSAQGLVLVCAAAGSAIICFVYAALILSGKIIRARPALKPPAYRAVFPEGLQTAFMVLLCAIGCLTLFSIPGGQLYTTLIFGGTVLVAGILCLRGSWNKPLFRSRMRTFGSRS